MFAQKAPNYSRHPTPLLWVIRRILGICVSFVACEIVTRRTLHSERREEQNRSTASSRGTGENLSQLSVKFHQLNFTFIADTSYGSDVAKFNCGEILRGIKADRMVRLFENCVLPTLDT